MTDENKIIEDADDIFADVDNSSAPITTLATDSGQALPPVILDDQHMHKRMIWLGSAVIALVVIGGGYFVYSKWFANNTNVENIPIENSQNVSNDVVDLQATSTNNQDAVASSSSDVTAPIEPVTDQQKVIDSDRDGLTDEEETILGTNLVEPDSDGDGLFDREEVKVYKTNPLNPDSDADGFTDGQEVAGGYNPNGTGKLYEFNIEQK